MTQPLILVPPMSSPIVALTSSSFALVIHRYVLDRNTLSTGWVAGSRSRGRRRIGCPCPRSHVPQAGSHGHGEVRQEVNSLRPDRAQQRDSPTPVSYTHLTLPTNREV